MATIENLPSIGAFRTTLEGYTESELLAQQLTQQGAIHVITFLLTNGCTEELASTLLANLRSCMREITSIAEAKGITALFDDAAPPNFN